MALKRMLPTINANFQNAVFWNPNIEEENTITAYKKGDKWEVYYCAQPTELLIGIFDEDLENLDEAVILKYLTSLLLEILE
jgi:D-hexose-6-phosphate mutarotase